MPRTRVKVMWDYDAFPLWEASVENLISPSLRSELQGWSDEWTDVMTGSDQKDWTPPGREQFETWDHRGRLLARRLQEELGAEYAVVYFNETTETPEPLDPD